MTETSITNDSGIHRMIALPHKVVPEDFVYEGLFGLPFHVDQQPGHCD